MSDPVGPGAGDEHVRAELGADGAWRIAQVVEWEHPHGPAHCLVRYYGDLPDRRPLAIVSELRTNPYLRGITGDFAAVAETFLDRWEGMVRANPESIVWLAQHGGFSSYDAPDQPTTFTRIDLRWEGTHYQDGYDRHYLLNAAGVADLIGGLELEPVPGVLAALDWT